MGHRVGQAVGVHASMAREVRSPKQLVRSERVLIAEHITKTRVPLLPNNVPVRERGQTRINFPF